MELQLRAVENDASAIEQFYKPKRKQLLKFKFDCNPSVVLKNKWIELNLIMDSQAIYRHHDLWPDDPKI